MSTSANISEIEEGLTFQPKFDASGLVTCVATDAATGDVLMVAHMNDEALRKTIASGEAWYFSRSRNALWRKGETSGQTQRVVEMRLDCDQDAVWIRVEQQGRRLPHRPALVLLSQDRGRRGRRTIVVRRCRQAVRSQGGLPKVMPSFRGAEGEPGISRRQSSIPGPRRTASSGMTTGGRNSLTRH